MDRDYKLDRRLSMPKSDLVSHIHEYDLDLKSNHIYLMGVDRGYDVVSGTEEPGIEFVIANRFVRNLNMCMRINPGKAIVIHMKTNGGSWEEGMAIYDIIRACPSPVTILNYTHARSMSSIIFQAGNKRVMMPHSYFMFHDGTMELSGTVKQVTSYTKFSKHADRVMLDIYSKAMQEGGEFKGKPSATIKKWLRYQMDKAEDVYLTANKTVELGLADAVFDYNWKKLTEYTEEQLKR